MAKWDVTKLEIISEAELINFIRNKMTAWAREEAESNDDSFEDRYEEAKWTFIEALKEEL